MQDIEKDMDDLFGKAVDNYQPNPGESNWERIEPRLLATPVIPATTKKENNTKTYFMLLFLLLFLLISGLLTKYIVDKNTTTVSHKPSANGINNSGEEQGKFDKEIKTEYE